jgi:hypothetical protein
MTVGEPVTFQGSVENREQVHAVTGQIMRQIELLSQHSQRRLAHRALRQATRRESLGIAVKNRKYFDWSETRP